MVLDNERGLGSSIRRRCNPIVCETGETTCH